MGYAEGHGENQTRALSAYIPNFAVHTRNLILTVYDLPVIYPALILGFFVILAISALAVWKIERGRRQKILVQWAKMRGLSYEDAPSGGKNSQDVLLAPLMMSGLLRRLEKLTVRNIMRGRFESHEFLIFDVHAWREHTLSESECIQWTVTIMLTEEHFPTLHIEPVVPAFSLLHPDRQSVKTQDEEFDRRFMVFGERSPVEHLLHQNLRNYLLGLTYTPERWYRHLYLHDNMIFLIEGTLAPPRHIEDMIRIIIGVRNHITVSADY